MKKEKKVDENWKERQKHHNAMAASTSALMRVWCMYTSPHTQKNAFFLDQQLRIFHGDSS